MNKIGLNGADYGHANCYLWFAFIFTTVIIIYSFGWSALNIPLSVDLLLVLLLMIGLSLLFGLIKREGLRYRPLERHPKHCLTILLLICFGVIAEICYYGAIPIIAYSSGIASYTSGLGQFSGIPTFHVVLISFATYYSIYLFYAFLSFKSKKGYLFGSFLILLLFLLESIRSHTMFVLFCDLVIFLEYRNGIGRKFSKRGQLIVVAIILLVLFGFGVYGNIRSGGAGWENSSFIEAIGRYTNWPSWIPKQFMWAYTYITCSLANLNYNAVLHNVSGNLIEFSGSLIPDFIFTRIGSEAEIALIFDELNTFTGFGNAYCSFGFAGMLLQFAFMILSVELSLALCNDYSQRLLINVIFSGVFSFTFFFNSFVSIGFSGGILFALLISFYISSSGKTRDGTKLELSKEQ